MMASGDIQLTLSPEFERLLATRVRICRAIRCKHNKYNLTGPGRALSCNLQEVEIEEGGGCGSFERIEEE